jgi:hypothetical protein
MKKVKLLVLLLPLLNGCNVQLDPKKPWIICNKDRYTSEINKIGLCRYKMTDGINSEYFDDSCISYRLGDTINHTYRDKQFDDNKKFADSIRSQADTSHLMGL